MDLKKKYLVAGAGVSGIAAAVLLHQAGEGVILYDGSESLQEEKIREELGEAGKIPVVLGELSGEVIRQIKICVISPGIPLTAPFVEQLKEQEIPIWSEIELAYRYGKGRIAAITGTNGKTTTTALVGAILSEEYDSVSVVGNIGTPYTSKALALTEDSVTAAEISSFQLESILDFHPNVSARVLPHAICRGGLEGA